MSDVPQGPGWFQATDGRWYPPQPAYPMQAGYPGQPAYGYAPPFAKPATNLVSGILATLLCCLPLGIVSIVYASQVDTKWAAGDWNGALDSSKKARLYANLSVGAAFILGLLYILAIALVPSSQYSY